jgi:hypothetical protein
LLGCEVLVDILAQRNLRDLRQPPRMRGTRWLSSLKNLSYSAYHDDVLDRALVANLVGLEDRHAVMTALDDNTRKDILDLSGWNHYKLTLNRGRLLALKLYGGTVRNIYFPVS